MFFLFGYATHNLTSFLAFNNLLLSTHHTSPFIKDSVFFRCLFSTKCQLLINQNRHLPFLSCWRLQARKQWTVAMKILKASNVLWGPQLRSLPNTMCSIFSLPAPPKGMAVLFSFSFKFYFFWRKVTFLCLNFLNSVFPVLQTNLHLQLFLLFFLKSQKNTRLLFNTNPYHSSDSNLNFVSSRSPND